MITAIDRATERGKIHRRIRRKISGNPKRPRLCVYRSLNHIYAQIVDDTQGTTMVAASSVEKEVREGLKNAGNIQAAKAVGKTVAQRAKAKGIEAVVFDRGGYLYHGRVKALADAARESGLKF
ncbi:MAG TPA: 50S ribosomal protein L18 [Acidobacteriota bacterium]|nr:50S ribosomal protein L18 [Acidobacteriota bacterium]